ncbi:MAG: pseudaminic acid synthase [Candidatus Omnitrophota bacterium]
MPEFQVNGRAIGPGHPCYVIAEMSANHAGSFDKALAIVRAAKESGADAIKLQTYTPDTMTIDCDNEYFQLHHPLWKDKTLYQLYKEAQTPWAWHRPLKEEADRLGLDFFSTPFDETAVDLLEGLGVGVYKIASFELVDDLLLKRVAQTRKPVIMSAGMSTLEEVRRAVEILRANGTEQLALLRCVSAYPARAEEMDLALIRDMAVRFNVVTGLSDHTTDSLSSIAGVAAGASIIEKHFKLSGDDTSPDAAFSLTPPQFHALVSDVRRTEAALGRAVYGPVTSEKGSLKFRRSLFFVMDLAAGAVVTAPSIRVIRPGDGLAPREREKILGRRLKKAVGRGQPVSWEDLDA